MPLLGKPIFDDSIGLKNSHDGIPYIIKYEKVRN